MRSESIGDNSWDYVRAHEPEKAEASVCARYMARDVDTRKSAGAASRRPYAEKFKCREACGETAAEEISNFRFEISDWGNGDGENRFKNPMRKHGAWGTR
jgi:hypothetical protein